LNNKTQQRYYIINSGLGNDMYKCIIGMIRHFIYPLLYLPELLLLQSAFAAAAVAATNPHSNANRFSLKYSTRPTNLNGTRTDFIYFH